jgi:hypothetical protein
LWFREPQKVVENEMRSAARSARFHPAATGQNESGCPGRGEGAASDWIGCVGHYPPRYLADNFAHIVKDIGPVAASIATKWSPDNAIEKMDRAGVATAVNSMTSPGVWSGDRETGRTTARVCNEFGAKLIRDFPGRFGMFAAIPLSDVDGIRSTGGHQCRLDDRARLGHGIRDWRHRRHADRAHRVPRAQHVGGVLLYGFASAALRPRNWATSSSRS